MEVIVEIVIQFFAEFLLQIIGELLINLGFHAASGKLPNRKSSPILAGAGYVSLGAILGFVSILIFPDSFLLNPTHKTVNLLITPVIVGFTMSLLGNIRKKKGKDTIRLDTFIFGFVFAFAMAFVRFFMVN